MQAKFAFQLAKEFETKPAILRVFCGKKYCNQIKLILYQTRLSVGFESPPSEFESHSLNTQPRMIKIPKNEPSKTQLHILENCQFDAAKMAPNTKRRITILHVINRKA